MCIAYNLERVAVRRRYVEVDGRLCLTAGEALARLVQIFAEHGMVLSASARQEAVDVYNRQVSLALVDECTNP